MKYYLRYWLRNIYPGKIININSYASKKEMIEEKNELLKFEEGSTVLYFELKEVRLSDDRRKH